MAGKNKPTENEHYIPQIYLKGFSPDKKRVYRFDLLAGTTKNILVPIRSVCYEKNLYEVRDLAGNIAFSNYIENHLSIIEGAFSEYRGKLIGKIDGISGPRAEILEPEEIAFWSMYTTIQILRNPQNLRTAEIYLEKLVGAGMTPTAAHADILGACFPFFKDSFLPEKFTLFKNYLEYLLNMEIVIGTAAETHFLTSDNPVCCYGEENPANGFSEVYFPVTSKIMLAFLKRDQLNGNNGNFRRTLNRDEVSYINDNIVFNARNSIFSEKPFSEEQIQEIREVQSSEQKADLIRQWNSPFAEENQ